MTVTSDAMSTNLSIGTNVTLTCKVILNHAIDVPVIVNSVWTGPDESMSERTSQDVNSSTYIGTSVIRSLQKSNCDNYTCTAIISSSSLFLSNSSRSGMKIIAIGKL